MSHRRFLRRWLTAVAAVSSIGAYGSQIEPYWLDEHRVPIPIPHFPTSLRGLRIAQLTDLHASDGVPLSYLRSVVQHVIAMDPDVVAITGDLVTHARQWVAPVCNVLAELPGHVIVCLGNHDYDVSDVPAGMPMRIADELEKRLTANGAIVLRNRAVAFAHRDGKLRQVERNQAAGDRIWFVGLEDLWSGRFNPQVAFAGLNSGETVIALSHNPDTSAALDGYAPNLILSGHTHGGQVRIPGFGPIILNVQDRTHDQGLFDLPHSRLYVSRGIGYLRHFRLFCRPELPCFVLDNCTSNT